MYATPLLSNGGTQRGLPISCYLNSVDDSLEGIVSKPGSSLFLRPLEKLGQSQKSEGAGRAPARGRRSMTTVPSVQWR